MFRRLPSTVIILSILLAITYELDPDLSFANSLGRDRDPLIIQGYSLPAFIGTEPSKIVAFSCDNGWVQIPVQIDEMDVVDFGTIYHTDPSGYTVLAYTDTSTFIGPDSDTLFDDNDELVIMAKDAGARSLAHAEPPGTLAGSGVELTVINLLNGATAYAYLFESDGSLDPSAGAHRVAYDFLLYSGTYKTTYNTQSGPNPENSILQTSAYSVHFGDRWIRDATKVTLGGATGIDILDRHKNLFGPGNCMRSENTFSNGEGAFIVNHEGPIRALRGYCGANSGPTTYRIHAFYEAREDITTVLRVHPIPGVMDYFDYSAQAIGMTYYNNNNTTGVTVDGNWDVILAGRLDWEMVTGVQGTLAVTHQLVTDISNLSPTNYYSDASVPPYVQCTGDSREYGASGVWINQEIPNTDPAVNPVYNILHAIRVIAYGAPSLDTSFVAACWSEANSPIAFNAEPYDPATSAESTRGATPAAPFEIAYWPNPAQGSLNVRFSMRAAGPLSVELYDVAGRRVARLIEGTWSAGAHEAFLSIARFPVGVYFARALSRGASQTSRIVILR